METTVGSLFINDDEAWIPNSYFKIDGRFRHYTMIRRNGTEFYATPRGGGKGVNLSHKSIIKIY